MNKNVCKRNRPLLTNIFRWNIPSSGALGCDHIELYCIRYSVYATYVHGESYRVARTPYSVFGADPIDTSDGEDLAPPLRADMVLVFVAVILWIP